ncbi:Exocyst complex component EXO70B1 [Sesamum alatum]|uniref:Exocyst subunit Exo70 family protein n=1 Tax=Sesamum alatum TaxID=300844 RepID=A0AAE1YCS3_9LAMI|nr:Exocyst complex component EXO70B1 [Sesamum alatum]
MLKTIVATFQTVMGSSLSQQSAVDTISQWSSRPPHELIFDSGRREISQYMQAVDRLQQSDNVRGSNELMSTALARLRREFIAVLSRQSEHHAGPSSTMEWSSVNDSTAYVFRYEDYVVSGPPNIDVVMYLRNIAERMNSSGRLGECIKVYKSLRKSFLQAQLKRLRFEELSKGCSTRRCEWDMLKVKMELWIQVSKICVKILFQREKKLCEQIFEGLGDNAVKDECFVGTVQEFAVDLFTFAKEMSMSDQPYDRMETILGVYDAFVWVLPSVDALFDSVPGEEIRNIFSETLSRIEKDVGRMLHGFEDTVLRGISDVSDNRGEVHELTEYVMKQIDLIVRNRRLLTSLIKSTPSLDFGDLIIPRGDLVDSHNRSFLELHLILIIVVLQRNLKKKSEFWEDPSLGQLFMMNNVRYIVQRIEGSHELQEMIGDSYFKKLHENVKSAMTNYQSSTCSKFLTCFEDEGLYVTRCFRSRPSGTAVRRRLKAFNAVFEDIHLLHSVWTIPDMQLKDDVRVSMCEKLVPAYKNFLEKFSNNPEIRLILHKHTKYSTEDLQALVLENLFAHTQVIA